jgi:hypothetical protein
MEGSLKDILILFMLIVVYFLPYFLIFKLIKLSAGALGKIQGALDSAGKWTNDRGPIKSFKENAQKSAQTKRKNKNLETIGNQTSIINSDANKVRKGYARLRRGVARSAIGTFGATGAYAEQLQGSEDRELMKDAKDTLNARLEGLDGGQQAQALRTILNDSNTTPQLQRQAIARAVQLGEVGLLQDYRNNPANYRTFQTAMSTDGQFSALDAMAPYLTRADSTTTAASASQQLEQSLKNFGSLKMGGIRERGVASNQQQLDTIAELQRRTTSIDTNTGAAVIEDRRFVTAAINQFAQREDLGQLDPNLLALFHNVTFSDGRTAADVIQSGGNLKVTLDPSTGATNVVTSDTV